ncbi:hypothetical protein WR25_07704 [Diploscapter pachys]|uniref:Uncharacterized protein n=1 Tax=Diploscapter pachys TaxID=2018661 RepID=A0A2A2L1D6_9BILA|nr:hypothetical protein WR25_07704 [Diploscapter pachys]
MIIRLAAILLTLSILFYEARGCLPGGGSSSSCGCSRCPCPAPAPALAPTPVQVQPSYQSYQSYQPQQSQSSYYSGQYSYQQPASSQSGYSNYAQGPSYSSQSHVQYASNLPIAPPPLPVVPPPLPVAPPIFQAAPSTFQAAPPPLNPFQSPADQRPITPQTYQSFKVQQNVDQKPRQEAYSIKPPGQVYRDTKTQPNDRSNRVELQAYQEIDPIEAPPTLTPSQMETTLDNYKAAVASVNSSSNEIGDAIIRSIESDITNAESQIQVESSPVASESEQTYLSIAREPVIEESPPFVTYYNQDCLGSVLASSSGETILSASKKCRLLGCTAANAKADGKGTYSITFLKTTHGRINKHGHYCLSYRRFLPYMAMANRSSVSNANSKSVDGSRTSRADLNSDRTRPARTHSTLYGRRLPIPIVVACMERKFHFPTFRLNSFNREAKLRSMIGPANSEESRKQNDDPTTVSEQEIAEPSHAPKSAPESRFWNHILKDSLLKWMRYDI